MQSLKVDKCFNALRSFARLLLPLALGLTACTGSAVAAPSDAPVLVEGQNIYASNCASCHRSNGSGGRGVKLNEGRVLIQYPDPADQAAVIANGRGTMPAFSGRLTDAQIDAVVRYTREVLNSSPAGS